MVVIPVPKLLSMKYEIRFFHGVATWERRILQRRFRKEATLFLEMEKVCSCFGHTTVDITEELRERTKQEIEKAIADGVRTFLFGGKSDFDDLVYDLVSERKALQPELEIKRVFCFPLINDLRKHPRWFIPKEYEELTCPPKSFDYWFTSLYYRNIAMIDESDLVLFYAMERAESGAYKAYKYAVKKHKKIVNFALS